MALAVVAKVYRNKVLAGMGEKGQKMQQVVSEIWAQDKAGCAIYSMPKAVGEAGVVVKVGALIEMM